MNTVLLIEDNVGDAELARLAFEEAAVACDLTIAETGENALRLLEGPGDVGKTYRPDLILLDLNLPGMHGTEVLRQLKSNSDLKRIPVIVISSSIADMDVAKSYDLHVNSYVRKPMDMAGLVKIAEAIGEFWLTITVPPPQSA